MEVNGGVNRLMTKVVLMTFVATTAAAYNTCQSGFVCKNSTHFKLCVVFANGSIGLWNDSTACPKNTVCTGSQCLDSRPSGYYPPSTRNCGVHGFICINSNEYQLCSYGPGYSYPWGPNYRCPHHTVCDETHPYHCQNLYPSTYATPETGHLPPRATDECKSKNFVCIDSNTYLMCRDMGDGTFKPYNHQYKCPGTQICHKSFDRPCAVAKSNGNSVYSKKWEIFCFCILLSFVYFKYIKLCWLTIG